MDRIEIIHRITEPTRYKIIGLLLKRHYCVRALAKSLGVSEPAVSQHIRALKETGIVTGERIGYQTHYIVKKESLAALFAEAAEEISECPPPPAIRKAWAIFKAVARRRVNLNIILRGELTINCEAEGE